MYCVAGMDDDEAFLPFDEDESEDDAAAAAQDAQVTLADDDDEETFLRGHTDAESDSGWDTGADTDVGFSGDDTDAVASGADNEDEELFPEGTDALAMLAGMEGQPQEAEAETLQPYEVLARQKRARRKLVMPYDLLSRLACWLSSCTIIITTTTAALTLEIVGCQCFSQTRCFWSRRRRHLVKRHICPLFQQCQRNHP